MRPASWRANAANEAALRGKEVEEMAGRALVPVTQKNASCLTKGTQRWSYLFKFLLIQNFVLKFETISKPKIKIQAFVHFYQLKGNFKPSQTLDLYILQIEKQK